jgi:dihydroflavonol-4-reductase
MRALVTGGTGFVGANLVAGLTKQGITARILRRPSSSSLALAGLEYETAVGDILGNQAALVTAMRGCDWVFHVAGGVEYWRQSADWVYRLNVQGTGNILCAARTVGLRRLVFTSSYAALGIPSRGGRLDESSQFNLSPRAFPYGHSKHLAELQVRRSIAVGLPAVIVNPTTIIGPRDLNQISGSIILELAKGRLFCIPPGGLNYVAVQDVVAGHIAAAMQGRIGERYILAGENLSYSQAFSTICDVIGRPPPRFKIPGWLLPVASLGVSVARSVLGNRVPLDSTQVRLSGLDLYADGRKAVQELGLPHTPFRLAVQQAFEWYQENGFFNK